MWRKNERLKVNGIKVYVDHVFDDGSASIREVKTGLLKGKVPAKEAAPKNDLAELSKAEILDTKNIEGVSVTDFNSLIKLREEYEEKAETFYLLEEENAPNLKQAEKEMQEALKKLTEKESQVFNY